MNKFTFWETVVLIAVAFHGALGIYSNLTYYNSISWLNLVFSGCEVAAVYIAYTYANMVDVLVTEVAMRNRIADLKKELGLTDEGNKN
jgi:hypothetical protein